MTNSLDLVPIAEAAQIIGRTPTTLRNWIKELRIQCVRKLGRIYFVRSELDRIAASPGVPEPAKKRANR